MILKEDKHRGEDRIRLEEAAALARKGAGAVEPNPMVGARVVQNGRVVAKGYHARYGGSHAEVQALDRAGELARGATLYLTPEPCSTAGKTPPCTDAIIKAGIERVVYGAVDPNPSHAGAADELLGEAGIEVLSGVKAAECRRLIRPFAKVQETGLPWVMVKSAIPWRARRSRSTARRTRSTGVAAR